MQSFPKKIVLLFASALLLTACQSKWRVETSLTDKEREAIMADIQSTEELIQQQIAEKGAGEIMAYVVIARDYEKLGDLKKAEKVYKDMLAEKRVASVIHNNLAKIYEKIGETDKAIEQYNILVNQFVEPRYLYDLTWLSIRTKDRKNAERYFNAWQREYSKTDEEIQRAIKELRAEEKAGKA